MPIYTYQCEKCGHKFDELVKGAEKVKCPECGSGKLKKLFAPFAVGTGPSPGSSCDSGMCPSSGGSCPTGTCGLS